MGAVVRKLKALSTVPAAPGDPYGKGERHLHWGACPLFAFLRAACRREDAYCPVRPMKASVFVTGGGFHLPVSTSDLGA